jgi:hypothetical protein
MEKKEERRRDRSRSGSHKKRGKSVDSVYRRVLLPAQETQGRVVGVEAAEEAALPVLAEVTNPRVLLSQTLTSRLRSCRERQNARPSLLRTSLMLTFPKNSLKSLKNTSLSSLHQSKPMLFQSLWSLWM